MILLSSGGSGPWSSHLKLFNNLCRSHWVVKSQSHFFMCVFHLPHFSSWTEVSQDPSKHIYHRLHDSGKEVGGSTCTMTDSNRANLSKRQQLVMKSWLIDSDSSPASPSDLTDDMYLKSQMLSWPEQRIWNKNLVWKAVSTTYQPCGCKYLYNLSPDSPAPMGAWKPTFMVTLEICFTKWAFIQCFFHFLFLILSQQTLLQFRWASPVLKTHVFLSCPVSSPLSPPPT